jgi:transcriptional regulator with XRE-family HTH domain
MGARLQAVRVEQDHTMKALGQSAGLNPGTIASIEKGGQAGVATVEALAVALGISPAWLAYGIGPQVLPSRRRSAAAAPAS